MYEGLSVKKLGDRVRQVVIPLVRGDERLIRDGRAKREDSERIQQRLVTDARIHDVNILDEAIAVRAQAVNAVVAGAPFSAEAEELWRVAHDVSTARDSEVYDQCDENVELGGVPAAKRAAMLERVLEHRAEMKYEGPHLFGDRPLRDVLAETPWIRSIAEVIHTDQEELQEAWATGRGGRASLSDTLTTTAKQGLPDR